VILAIMALGAMTGAGLWCVVRAFAPQPASLARDLAALTQPVLSDGASSLRARTRQAAVRVGRWGSVDPRLRADLELLERSDERFAIERCTAALIFAALPVLFALVVAPASIALNGGLVLALSVGLGIVGFVLPVLTVRSEADKRRRSARLALGAYLDVVAILLAGGHGPTSALADAAAAGQGWLFRRLDRAMRTAAASNTTPWDELTELAERLALTDLFEFASSLALAGTAGAAVRDTLLAKADTLRTKALADAEAQARHSSELLVLPAVAMLVAFMLLLGFPATYRIMGF
jgi:Flp pilus assembly protein TadB